MFRYERESASQNSDTAQLVGTKTTRHVSGVMFAASSSNCSAPTPVPILFWQGQVCMREESRSSVEHYDVLFKFLEKVFVHICLDRPATHARSLSPKLIGTRHPSAEEVENPLPILQARFLCTDMPPP